jgi:hypothetical protein
VLGCWEGKRAGDEKRVALLQSTSTSQKRLLVPEHTETSTADELSLLYSIFFCL